MYVLIVRVQVSDNLSKGAFSICCTTMAFGAVLATLLVIGGVEMNPGPGTDSSQPTDSNFQPTDTVTFIYCEKMYVKF